MSLSIFASCLAREVDLLSETPEPFSAFTGFSFHSRVLEGQEKETVQQWVLPILMAARVAEDLQIRAYQTLSGAQLENGPDLNGLENTRIRCSYNLLEDALVTYVGLSVPVNSAELEKEEVYLSDLLYREVLDFGVNRITEGLDLDFGFAFTQPLGNMSLGLGMGYLLRSSYERLAQEGKYNPGNRLSLLTGLSSSIKAIDADIVGRFLYIYYGDDKIEAKDDFKNSDAISFLVFSKLCLKSFILRLSLEETARLANAVGALCVTGVGATGGVRSLPATMAFIESAKTREDLMTG